MRSHLTKMSVISAPVCSVKQKILFYCSVIMIALSQYFVPPQYRKLSQCSWFEMVTIKPKCVNPLVRCDISFVLVQTFTTALSKNRDLDQIRNFA